jgi:hypothetical protein
VSNERTERLVNLVLCLLSSRRFQTATKIARTVPGYEHDPEDKRAHEAFQRKFERDKAELRDLGVPLETGRLSSFDTVDGYRIARQDYELGEIRLRLLVGAKPNGILHTHRDLRRLARKEKADEAIDTSHVRSTNRRHGNDPPIDQLDTVILVQDARLAHGVELVDGEQALLECDLRTHDGSSATIEGTAYFSHFPPRRPRPGKRAMSAGCHEPGI